MKVRFFCVETHGGGPWKRFDFSVQGGGTDCPKGSAVLYAVDPGDFLAFEPGKMYETDFSEVKDDQGHVRKEPEAQGIRPDGGGNGEEAGNSSGERESGAGSVDAEGWTGGSPSESEAESGQGLE